MTDQHGELLQKLADLRAMVDQATLGPWRSVESRDFWTLHGEARSFVGKGKRVIAPSMQIAKAPKTGMAFAEYWPNPADSALIVEAVNQLPFWLDWAEDVLRRHHPAPCTCRDDHFLCADNRMYEWSGCPEVKAVTRALNLRHSASS